MKIKMPCKLCELSLETQKWGGCTHSPFLPPIVQPLGFGMQTNPFVQLPHMRDVMLAAYLLRGEVPQSLARSSQDPLIYAKIFIKI